MAAVGKQLMVENIEAERDRRLRFVLSNTMQKARALNLPVIYRNELCVEPNMFIHKYPNGHTVLIEQDAKSFVSKTVKILNK